MVKGYQKCHISNTTDRPTAILMQSNSNEIRNGRNICAGQKGPYCEDGHSKIMKEESFKD
jgi:hypothetical protein